MAGFSPLAGNLDENKVESSKFEVRRKKVKNFETASNYEL